jgi:hypothetical protein
VPGSLNKKGGRRFHLSLSKRLHLLPPFLSNEPVTVLYMQYIPVLQYKLFMSTVLIKFLGRGSYSIEEEQAL